MSYSGLTLFTKPKRKERIGISVFPGGRIVETFIDDRYIIEKERFGISGGRTVERFIDDRYIIEKETYPKHIEKLNEKFNKLRRRTGGLNF